MGRSKTAAIQRAEARQSASFIFERMDNKGLDEEIEKRYNQRGQESRAEAGDLKGVAHEPGGERQRDRIDDEQE